MIKLRNNLEFTSIQLNFSRLEKKLKLNLDRL